LLAFSRRQAIQPKPQNLNRTVADSTEMLGRLLGQDIEFKTILSPELPPVVADRSQIEQVLMNLAANARDAMPRGGHFSIVTRRVERTPNDVLTHIGNISGPCVLLSAIDTGQGMDAPTRARIFEPFFTTKPTGQGTGLGLSTVYGDCAPERRLD
jgi:two-component system cell cycle sensor histidine kinase/response regulator CckA